MYQRSCLIFILVQLYSVIHVICKHENKDILGKRDLFCLVIRRGLRISFQILEKFIKFLRNLSGLLKKRLALKENLKLCFSLSLFLKFTGRITDGMPGRKVKHGQCWTCILSQPAVSLSLSTFFPPLWKEACSSKS